MALFSKRSPEEEAALEIYKVVYKGGHPDLPKAKSGEIRLLDIADQIAKLAALRDQGILSEDEFAAKKADLLDRM